MNPHYGKFEEDTFATYTTRESISAQLDREYLAQRRHFRMTARMGMGVDWAKDDHGLTHKPLPIESCSYWYEVHAEKLVPKAPTRGSVSTPVPYWDKERVRVDEPYRAAELNDARRRVDGLKSARWEFARVLYVPSTLAAERGARVRLVYGEARHTK